MSSDGGEWMDQWKERIEGRDAGDLSTSGYARKRGRRGILANMDSDTGGKRPGGHRPDRPSRHWSK